MKKIIHSYPNFIIGTLAVVFFAILVVFYSWAVEDAVGSLQSALVTPAPQMAGGYNLSAAAEIDYRGLISTSTTSSTSGN